MEGMAQWTMSDVPRLIAEGRRAAISALDLADAGRWTVAASDDVLPEAEAG
jgi:NTE family protein